MVFFRCIGFLWALGSILFLVSIYFAVTDGYLKPSKTEGKNWDLYFTIFPNIPIIIIQPFVFIWDIYCFKQWIQGKEQPTFQWPFSTQNGLYTSLDEGL
jgi:hypothetical protein